jgi:hypothetical protein
MGITIKKREIMMFIDEIERLRAASWAADDDVRHHLRSDKIGHALLHSHPVKAVRDVRAENTKIDP